ncbi:MAG: hypothetical protein R3A47_05155 [Polyangiales bacterium]
MRISSIPPRERLLIRQASNDDLDAVTTLAWAAAERWGADKMPLDRSLENYLGRLIGAQDAVFQFWIAEDGHGRIVAWEALNPCSADPVVRNLVGELTICLGEQRRAIAKYLLTHAVRHAQRTHLQHVVARPHSNDNVLIDSLDEMAFHRVGVWPASLKFRGWPECIEYVHVVPP